MNIQKFEINKPSELCQVVFVHKFNKDYEMYKISPLQLDMMNGIIYKVREIINKEKIEIDTEIPSTLFEISLKDFTSMFTQYNNNDYKFMLEKLDELSDIRIIVNALNKNKDVETVVTRLIHEIRISKHKYQKNQKIRVAISNVLIDKFMHVEKYFSKMFFAIQFSMVSKYSKLLYEILKDYEGIKTLTLDIKDIFELINVTEQSQKKWSIFQGNILKKAITEINEKSDIFVEYIPIKEKPEGDRLQVTKIKFNIKKQSESQLKQLGLIQESISANPLYNKSKSKLDKLVAGGYNVIDEEMWIKTDIKTNEEKYNAENRIDIWLHETSQIDKNEIFEIIANNIDNCDDPIITINDYIIKGVFSNDSFTKNALETIEVLNQVISTIS